MRKEYGSKLTREELINKYGIIGVSPAGTSLMRRNKRTGKIWIQTKFCKNNSDYYIVTLYDPEVRKAIPKEERTNGSGQVIIPLHKIIYAYMYGSTTEGYVIDHINKNKIDNDYRNLREITPQENVTRDTDKNTKLIKCNLKLSREWYLDKIEYWEEQYELAKDNHDAELAHGARSMLAWYRGKLRFYDKNNGE